MGPKPQIETLGDSSQTQLDVTTDLVWKPDPKWGYESLQNCTTDDVSDILCGEDDMGDFIDYLQHRVKEVQGDLEDANARLQKAEADRTMLMAELQGYERTLTAEMRRQGLAANAAAPDAQERLVLSDPVNIGTVNKAEFARQFIRERADTGATPNDLFKGFQDAGIPIKKPYIYALVQRLQTQTAIRSRRGKWYPVPESEQSANGTAEKTLP